MDQLWSSPWTGMSLVLLPFISSSDFDGISSMIARSIHTNKDLHIYISLGIALLVAILTDLFYHLVKYEKGKIDAPEEVKGGDKKDVQKAANLKQIEEMKLALIDYRKVCKEREESLGKDHPNTATQYNNIGALLDKLGDIDGALKEFSKARDSFENSCGRGHPLTATAYNNIAGILRKQGNLEGALTEYFKVLSVQEKVLGKYCKETAQTLNNIGVIQFKLGDKGALKNFEKSLKIYTEILGSKHPKTEQTKQAFAFAKRMEKASDTEGASD